LGSAGCSSAESSDGHSIRKTKSRLSLWFCSCKVAFVREQRDNSMLFSLDICCWISLYFLFAQKMVILEALGGTNRQQRVKTVIDSRE